MTARDLAAEFVLRALRESGISATELMQKSGMSLRAIHCVVERTNVKHSCRLDTLLALLSACGYELKMEKKR